jgi:hypothetical protein
MTGRENLGEGLAMREAANAGVQGAPHLLLRLEGMILFGAAVLAYTWTGASWWLFALAFLAPDLGMLGYAAGPRTGAAVYNATHTTLAPALLAGAGTLLGAPMAIPLAAIWAAHIGFDRVLGYGLKYPTGFGDTHLASLGSRAAPGSADVKRIGRHRRVCRI